MLMLWARRTILDIELPLLSQYLQQLENEETVDVDLLTQHETLYKEGLVELEKLTKLFVKAHDEIKKQIREKLKEELRNKEEL